MKLQYFFDSIFETVCNCSDFDKQVGYSIYLQPQFVVFPGNVFREDGGPGLVEHVLLAETSHKRFHFDTVFVKFTTLFNNVSRFNSLVKIYRY